MANRAARGAPRRAFVRRWLIAVAIAGAAGCASDELVGPGSDRPAYAPGPKTQQIAFASNRDGNWEIYRVNADGTGLLRLTNNASSDGPNGLGGYEIVWSPDGDRIAFTTDRTGSVEIAVMNADGTGFRYLTNIAGDEHDLAWSPDGSRIAFARQRPTDTHSDVWYVTTNGKPAETNFTGTAFSAEDQPSWSPDGVSIAYRSLDSSFLGSYSRILAVALAGGVVHAFGYPAATDPSWSPDGTRIAFIDANGDDDIYAYTLEGMSVAELLDHAGTDARPKWSPDGARLVFEKTSGSVGIWTVNANGTSPMQIALAGTARPSWAPNSTRIAYERPDVLATPWLIRPISDIYTVLPSGSSPILVVPGPASLNVNPVYRPQ